MLVKAGMMAVISPRATVADDENGSGGGSGSGSGFGNPPPEKHGRGEMRRPPGLVVAPGEGVTMRRPPGLVAPGKGVTNIYPPRLVVPRGGDGVGDCRESGYRRSLMSPLREAVEVSLGGRRVKMMVSTHPLSTRPEDVGHGGRTDWGSPPKPQRRQSSPPQTGTKNTEAAREAAAREGCGRAVGCLTVAAGATPAGAAGAGGGDSFCAGGGFSDNRGTGCGNAGHGDRKPPTIPVLQHTADAMQKQEVPVQADRLLSLPRATVAAAATAASGGDAGVDCAQAGEQSATSIRRRVEAPQIRKLREERRVLCVLMRYRLEISAENLRGLDRVILASEARRAVVNAEVKAATEVFRRDMAEANRFRLEAEACKAALAEVAVIPSVPANSIARGVYGDWFHGREFKRFVAKTRERYGDGSDELFVATDVVSQQHRARNGGEGGSVWAVGVKELGQGTFGIVTRLDVLTLGKSYAAKEFKDQGEGGDNGSWMRGCAQAGLLTEMIVHNSMPPHANIAGPSAMDDRDKDSLVVFYDLAVDDFHGYATGQVLASPGVLMRLLSDMARGLEHLGRHGVSHNDVKPGNMLVFQDSGVLVAKVTDLGCALAHGDMRRGQGTIGGQVPEGMMSREVACEPSQDVFALAHMVLLTLTKDEWKSSNMWFSQAVQTDGDKEIASTMEARNASVASKHHFMDEVTLRNQIDPRARAALLNPEHLYDGLTDGVKEKVVILLAKALSPDPTKRPPMAEMLAELDDMNECLLEIETRGVILAATAAVAGEGPSRTVSTDAGTGGVADDHGAPHPPPPLPATLEAVSGAFEGRGSAVPQQVAAVAGVNVIPSIFPEVAVGPAVSRETADGSAAAEEEEGGGGGRSALAPLATPATDVQRSTVSRPLQEGSVPVLGVVSGGIPSHNGRSGGDHHVVPVASTASVVQSEVVTGGSAAVMPVSAGAGGGVAVTAAVGGGRRVVDSQARLLQHPARRRSPRTGDVAAAGRVVRAKGGRGTGLVPRALAVNDAAPYVVGGGDGGGLRTSHHSNRLPAGPAPRRSTTRRNAAGGARMDAGRVTNSHRATNTARGGVPPFAHRQLPLQPPRSPRPGQDECLPRWAPQRQQEPRIFFFPPPGTPPPTPRRRAACMGAPPPPRRGEQPGAAAPAPAVPGIPAAPAVVGRGGSRCRTLSVLPFGVLDKADAPGWICRGRKSRRVPPAPSPGAVATGTTTFDLPRPELPATKGSTKAVTIMGSLEASSWRRGWFCRLSDRANVGYRDK
ncbi:conserved unknown protein [Ectocarpus siliculosus]|uniref:Protein kinase domain-containing protein n=1 Tax=Ectocarpus siliculosus TaxID=2880 RepID=D7FWL9_ECTSI|nr:conserved unknown protein [Ectocarpus siliculosus]|eukprot:CBJ32107.1 conserved unknown protein [Ectocarpus siliculosus]